MARERYLIGVKDETNPIHDNVIVANTPVKKAKNWWHYHYKTLIVIALILGAIGSWIYSVVTQIHPDYTISIMGDTYISPELATQLENKLAEYGDDVNGDGNVVVTINNLNVAATDDTIQTDVAQAVFIKYVADVSSGDSVIWLLDEYGYGQMGDEADEILKDIGNKDGEGMEKDTLLFNDVEALKNMELESEYEAWSNEQYKKITLERYSFAIRDKDAFSEAIKDSHNDYIDANYVLFERLMNDQKPER